MSYRFVGEGIPELKEIPEEERRRCFLRAVGRSYLRGRTWLGLLLFIGLSYVGSQYSKEIANSLGEAFLTPTRGEMLASMGLSMLALLALYKCQIEIIKSEIRKMRNPNKPPEGTR